MNEHDNICDAKTNKTITFTRVPPDKPDHRAVNCIRPDGINLGRIERSWQSWCFVPAGGQPWIPWIRPEYLRQILDHIEYLERLEKGG